MDLGLRLRSAFVLEKSVDDEKPERFSMGTCELALGRAQDDNVEKRRELELLPSFTVRSQRDQDPPHLSNEQRLGCQKNNGEHQRHFGQGVGLPDANSSPIGEMEEETSTDAAPNFWLDLSGDRRGDNGGGDGDLTMTRKKLRLSKDQSAHLESVFRKSNTLNQKLKIDLARNLGLGTRQVEVWFQNRRARTKLKQTEVEREYFKRWCERLTEDNRRLQRELRALKGAATHSNASPVGASALTMCSSCAVTATAFASSQHSTVLSLTPRDGGDPTVTL